MGWFSFWGGGNKLENATGYRMKSQPEDILTHPRWLDFPRPSPLQYRFHTAQPLPTDSSTESTPANLPAFPVAPRNPGWPTFGPTGGLGPEKKEEVLVIRMRRTGIAGVSENTVGATELSGAFGSLPVIVSYSVFGLSGAGVWGLSSFQARGEGPLPSEELGRHGREQHDQPGREFPDREQAEGGEAEGEVSRL